MGGIFFSKADREEEKELRLRSSRQPSQKKITNVLDAAADRRKLVLLYVRKKDGEVVQRKICPYSIRGGKYLFGTHNGYIKKFILSRIVRVDVLQEEGFRPKYEIEL